MHTRDRAHVAVRRSDAPVQSVLLGGRGFEQCGHAVLDLCRGEAPLRVRELREDQLHVVVLELRPKRWRTARCERHGQIGALPRPANPGTLQGLEQSAPTSGASIACMGRGECIGACACTNRDDANSSGDFGVRGTCMGCMCAG